MFIKAKFTQTLIISVEVLDVVVMDGIDHIVLFDQEGMTAYNRKMEPICSIDEDHFKEDYISYYRVDKVLHFHHFSPEEKMKRFQDDDLEDADVIYDRFE